MPHGVLQNQEGYCQGQNLQSFHRPILGSGAEIYNFPHLQDRNDYGNDDVPPFSRADSIHRSISGDRVRSSCLSEPGAFFFASILQILKIKIFLGSYLDGCSSINEVRIFQCRQSLPAQSRGHISVRMQGDRMRMEVDEARCHRVRNDYYFSGDEFESSYDDTTRRRCYGRGDHQYCRIQGSVDH